MDDPELKLATGRSENLGTLRPRGRARAAASRKRAARRGMSTGIRYVTHCKSYSGSPLPKPLVFIVEDLGARPKIHKYVAKAVQGARGLVERL